MSGRVFSKLLIVSLVVMNSRPAGAFEILGVTIGESVAPQPAVAGEPVQLVGPAGRSGEKGSGPKRSRPAKPSKDKDDEPFARRELNELIVGSDGFVPTDLVPTRRVVAREKKPGAAVRSEGSKAKQRSPIELATEKLVDAEALLSGAEIKQRNISDECGRFSRSYKKEVVEGAELSPRQKQKLGIDKALDDASGFLTKALADARKIPDADARESLVKQVEDDKSRLARLTNKNTDLGGLIAAAARQGRHFCDPPSAGGNIVKAPSDKHGAVVNQHNQRSGRNRRTGNAPS